MTIKRKMRVDGVVQGYHVNNPGRKLVDVLGLPSLRFFSKDELSRRYPISVRKGMLLYRGPGMRDPGASNFRDMLGDEEVRVSTKNLYHVAHLKDLFKYGPHVKIFNRAGQLVREAVLTPRGIRLDPKSGNPSDIVWLAPEADLLYEPWWEDFGSFLFVMPKTGPPGLRDHLVKLGIEDDKVVQGP